MTSPLRSQLGFDNVQTIAELKPQLDNFLERLQNGSILMLGLRPQLGVAPTDAPSANQPTLRLVSGLGSVPVFYSWNGSAWVAMTTGGLPGPHVLADSTGLGSQHTTSGLTSGMPLVATGATTARFGATVVTTYGGTGLTTFTAGDVPYYASGTALSKLAIGTSNQVLTSTGTAPQWVTNIAYGALPTGGGTWANGGTLSITGGVTTVAGLTSSALITASAGLTVASGQTLTVTGATIIGLTAASVGAGTFPSGTFVLPGTLNLTSATLNLTTATVSGAPTWSSNQAITLSTAAQPNVTSLGTLTSLTMGGTLTMGANTLALASATVSGQPTWSSSQAITISTATQASITTMANLTTVGALASGSIAAGFGNINNASNSLTTGALTAASASITNNVTMGTAHPVLTFQSPNTTANTVTFQTGDLAEGDFSLRMGAAGSGTLALNITHAGASSFGSNAVTMGALTATTGVFDAGSAAVGLQVTTTGSFLAKFRYDASNYFAMQVASNGDVTYSANGSGNSRHLFNGPIQLPQYTVATLPLVTQGAIAAVTDLLAPTFLGIAAGGGTTKGIVFYNGTNWVVG